MASHDHDPIVSKTVTLPISYVLDLRELSQRTGVSLNAITQQVVREGIKTLKAKNGIGIQA